jgi:hypothetical protein
MACTLYTGWRADQTDSTYELQPQKCESVRFGGKKRTNPGRRERETRRRMKFSSNNGLQTREYDSGNSEKTARPGQGRRDWKAQRKQLVCSQKKRIIKIGKIM